MPNTRGPSLCGLKLKFAYEHPQKTRRKHEEENTGVRHQYRNNEHMIRPILKPIQNADGRGRSEFGDYKVIWPLTVDLDIDIRNDARVG
jgi:hypothetical protein